MSMTERVAPVIAASSAPPVYHPAGFDAALRTAVDDLSAGRWLSAERLLTTPSPTPAVWTFWTQVLALVAARSAVLGEWAREHPDARGLGVLRLRVMVEHALTADRAGRPQAWKLEQAARVACWTAAHADPADPVPWVCLLALAVLDRDRSLPEHRVRSTDPMLPAGPWGMFDEVLRRDPVGREAHHRMYRYWQQESRSAALDFVHMVTTNALPGSPIAALPLYASVDQYRTAPRRDAVVRGQWRRDPHFSNTQRAYRSWRSAEPGSWTVSDLSHLAHALWASAQMDAAVEVFEALGVLASRTPWSDVAESREMGEVVLLTARQQAFAGRATALA
ncbi:hypothetical protein ACIHEI_28405 [Kitasatospora sp. NPDC051984]|uniref:hypothetical protein n=1 Tax=Kitasatospora sp. NPDC051984 TaxID=3364059 RepID=UPI0037CA4360